MTPPPNQGKARFVFAVCQVGAERALKGEVAIAHPGLHAAFGRPGLVTWKSTDEDVDAGFALRSVFARCFGAALGPATDAPAVLALLDAQGVGPPRLLHVFPRDATRPGEASKQSDASTATVIVEERAASLRAELLARGGARFHGRLLAEPGDLVLDVVVPPTLDEPLFVGEHLQQGAHLSRPLPGGHIPVEVPAEAPSRAYRKIEEAIRWSGFVLSAGQAALEIGSAPGGASYALLRRGLRVTGIDPGEMDEVVLRSPRFRHLPVAVGDARRADLPPRIDWLVLDVNLAPQVALKAARGIVSMYRSGLRGVIFTLKLNDWDLAARVPEFLHRVEEMGLEDVRATQLPANRQEICVVATGPR